MGETEHSWQTYRVQTLGCKSNQYDSQRLAEALMGAGFFEADEDRGADLYVINTCTVTQAADRKARRLIRRTIREHPKARVFVTGCYADREPEAIREIEGVEGVFGRDEWRTMLQDMAGERIPSGALLGAHFGVTGWSGRARALMKIQDGCDFFCAYCVVPHVRGKARSAPLRHVENEAKTLADAGFKEIVVTGIHLGIYGRDLAGGVELADAVERMARVPGIERIRLSSIEALEVTERLLEIMQHPKVCPHLHLPLQSGDDEVLLHMRRRYTSTQFLEAVAAARRALDTPAITTDVVVGLPGETDAAFERTLQVCRSAGFSRMHVFPFSPRRGTPAAGMDGRPHSRAVRHRVSATIRLADQLAGAWAQRFVGQRVQVLFEEANRQGDLVGYTGRYVRLGAPGSVNWIGALAHVECTGCSGPSLVGRIVGPPPSGQGL